MRAVLLILASLILGVAAGAALAEKPEHPSHPMPPPGKAIGWHARNDGPAPGPGPRPGTGTGGGTGTGTGTDPVTGADPGTDLGTDPVTGADTETGTSDAQGPLPRAPWIADAGGSPLAPPAAGTAVPAADAMPPSAAPPEAAAPIPPAPAVPAVVVATVALGAAAATTAGVAGARTGLLRRWWLWLLVPLYSRLKRAEVLSSASRRRVYDAIVAQPGVHVPVLRRALGIENGVLLHHLQVLERNGYVRTDVDERERRYWAAGATPPVPPRPALSTQVFDFVAHHPSATSAQVAAALEKRPTLVHYHVLRLEHAGQLRRERHGREVHLYARS